MFFIFLKRSPWDYDCQQVTTAREQHTAAGRLEIQGHATGRALHGLQAVFVFARRADGERAVAELLLAHFRARREVRASAAHLVAANGLDEPFAFGDRWFGVSHVSPVASRDRAAATVLVQLVEHSLAFASVAHSMP
jgi:hypothetical protein